MAAIMNYNGRGDVSSARANAALGAIIVDNTVLLYYLYAIINHNVTRTYMYVRVHVRTYIYMLCSRASATRRKAERDQRCREFLIEGVA